MPAVTNPTPVVAPPFDDWVAEHFTETTPGACTGCLRPADQRWSDTANSYCERCLRYAHGRDEGDALALAAAIAHALDAGHPVEFVHAVVVATARAR